MAGSSRERDAFAHRLPLFAGPARLVVQDNRVGVVAAMNDPDSARLSAPLRPGDEAGDDAIRPGPEQSVAG
jgi:hypothetical protein